MRDIYLCKGMPPGTTVRDVRWGREHDGMFVWGLGGHRQPISETGIIQRYIVSRRDAFPWGWLLFGDLQTGCYRLGEIL